MELIQRHTKMLCYELLSKLDETKKDYYEECVYILKEGIEYHYNDIFAEITPDDEVVTTDVSQEVLNIVNMYDDIYRYLTNHAIVMEEYYALFNQYAFNGFSRHDEIAYNTYYQYLLKFNHDKALNINDFAKVFNGNNMSLTDYISMYRRYIRYKGIDQALSIEWIIYILSGEYSMINHTIERAQ